MSLLSHAERSRTLMRAGTGQLGTLSEGYPYVSLIQYAVGPSGQPLLLISELAEHTQNLRLDPRASLLAWELQERVDPLAAARVTVMGTMVEAPGDLLEVYLQALPQARQYARFKDFHLWSMEVERVRYIAGFGEMSWVNPQEYQAARPDPVAPLAAGVIQHMNEDHSDALLLLASQKLQRGVSQAVMVSCDGAGYQLRVDDRETVCFEFAQRCSNSDELRQEFIRQVGVARG